MTVRITSTYQRTDNGLDAVVRELLKKVHIDVGIHAAGGDARYADGKTIVEVAIENEFGLGKPQRSWARAWLNEKHEEITRILGPIPVVVLMGERSLADACYMAAQELVESMRQRIRDRISPANSPTTIARKGSDVPLIDTEHFIDTIAGKAYEP